MLRHALLFMHECKEQRAQRHENRAYWSRYRCTRYCFERRVVTLMPREERAHMRATRERCRSRTEELLLQRR